jgi:NADPH:quinone reductase-like Zn-dependent oxidoreductase
VGSTQNVANHCVAVLRTVLDRIASGALKIPPAVRYPLPAVAEALHSAEANARQGKPLLDFAIDR